MTKADKQTTISTMAALEQVMEGALEVQEGNQQKSKMSSQNGANSNKTTSTKALQKGTAIANQLPRQKAVPREPNTRTKHQAEHLRVPPVSIKVLQEAKAQKQQNSLAITHTGTATAASSL